MPTDDPGEIFDLCTPDGRPLGQTKARALVHRDGDWHRSLHLWVVLTSTTPPSILLQRRSLTKDTHPGKVDVSVAGHLHAGESVADALREADEEIGLVVGPSDVIRLGVRRRVDARPPAHLDREVQEVLCTFTRRALESFRPDPDEVRGLLAVPLPAALRLVRDGERAAGLEIRSGETSVRAVSLARNELLPDPDGYFAVVIDGIARRLGGAIETPWLMGGADEGTARDQTR
jgi:isopentenyldiphosphate isomerase